MADNNLNLYDILLKTVKKYNDIIIESDYEILFYTDERRDLIIKLYNNNKDCHDSGTQSSVDERGTCTIIIRLKTTNEICAYLSSSLTGLDGDNNKQPMIYINHSCTDKFYRKRGLSLLLRIILIEAAINEPNIVGIISATNDHSHPLLSKFGAISYRQTSMDDEKSLNDKYDKRNFISENYMWYVDIFIPTVEHNDEYIISRLYKNSDFENVKKSLKDIVETFNKYKLIHTGSMNMTGGFGEYNEFKHKYIKYKHKYIKYKHKLQYL